MNNFQWRVIVEIKSGFNPVSILWYATTSYRDAFDYLETRQHLITKKRKIFVKQTGTKHRHLGYDPVFDIELTEDTSSDEWYEEDTTDDLASVRLEKRKGFAPIVWRGLQRGRSVPTMDSVLDEEGGLG